METFTVSHKIFTKKFVLAKTFVFQQDLLKYVKDRNKCMWQLEKNSFLAKTLTKFRENIKS
jgi:hypothetical protein